MQFAYPWLMLIALVIPVMVFFYIRRGNGGQIKFPTLKTIKRLRTSKSVYARHILIVLRSLSLAFLIAAIARPQLGRKTTEIMTEGVNIMLVLDTSGSMQALDFKLEGQRINRLAIVKKVVADFIKGRENDRMGMVVFGQEAFTQCPLTLDHGVLISFLDMVKSGMAGDSTAVGSAIGTAVKRLKDIQAKSRVMILLTDGRNNAGRLDPIKAAEIANKYGIKIYTIGAGTEGKAPFLVNTFFGPQYVYVDVDLDEDTLKEISRITGGQYFRATDTESLKNIYAQIDKMEKSQVKIKEYMEYNELFLWLALAGLGLLLLEILLANTRFRKIP